MQYGWVSGEFGALTVILPPPEDEVIPGVSWGAIDAFPSPAYWKYQVLARRHQGTQIRYRLGSTLIEEVGACLLGGHGIPAAIGLAAFEHLKSKGAFSGAPHCEDILSTWLSEPLAIDGRKVRYRFVRQKTKYIASALNLLNREAPPLQSGKTLRDWLVRSPGIGYKTASWIARNWLDANDVAILDIHVLRAGQLGRFFRPELTVQRNYLEIEEQFIRFSAGLNVSASELDAVIWHEMMASPQAVHRLLSSQNTASVPMASSSRRPRPKQRRADTGQLSLSI